MHDSVMTWVGEQVRYYDLAPDKEILEVGSYNVNGTVRVLFPNCWYMGVDMRAGPGVDATMNSHELEFPEASFDAVVSTEMLEHDPLPYKSLAEMARVLRPGGHCLITARGYDERGCFPVHEFPGDYLRYSCAGMGFLLADAGLTPLSLYKDPMCPGVFAVAVK